MPTDLDTQGRQSHTNQQKRTQSSKTGQMKISEAPWRPRRDFFESPSKSLGSPRFVLCQAKALIERRSTGEGAECLALMPGGGPGDDLVQLTKMSCLST